MICFNIAFVFYSIGCSFFFIEGSNSELYESIESVTSVETTQIFTNVYVASVGIIISLVLAYSAFKIRKTIKDVRNAVPNENLVRIHIANTVIYTILLIVICSLRIIYHHLHLLRDH